MRSPAATTGSPSSRPATWSSHLCRAAAGPSPTGLRSSATPRRTSRWAARPASRAAVGVLTGVGTAGRARAHRRRGHRQRGGPAAAADRDRGRVGPHRTAPVGTDGLSSPRPTAHTVGPSPGRTDRRGIPRRPDPKDRPQRHGSRTGATACVRPVHGSRDGRRARDGRARARSDPQRHARARAASPARRTPPVDRPDDLDRPTRDRTLSAGSPPRSAAGRGRRAACSRRHRRGVHAVRRRPGRAVDLRRRAARPLTLARPARPVAGDPRGHRRPAARRPDGRA